MPAHDSLSLEAMSARAGSLTQYAQRQARQAAASSGMHDGAHGADSWQQQGRHMDTSETSSGSRLSSGGMNGVELTTRAAYSAPQFTYAQEAAHQAQVLHHQQLEHERLRQRERMVREREREREEQLIRSHSRHQQQHQSSQRPSGEQQHRVYLLNCKHCGNFLSDRGMKVSRMCHKDGRVRHGFRIITSALKGRKSDHGRLRRTENAPRCPLMLHTWVLTVHDRAVPPRNIGRFAAQAQHHPLQHRRHAFQLRPTLSISRRRILGASGRAYMRMSYTVPRLLRLRCASGLQHCLTLRAVHK